jgi:peptidoglycan/LPS O-acetylase OafA/YrhL
MADGAAKVFGGTGRARCGGGVRFDPGARWRATFETASWHWFGSSFSPYDYVVAVFVALFIVGLANAPLPVPGTAVQRLIRFRAGTTFGLYLLHQPLLNFFGTIIPGPPDRLMHGLPVFGLTLGVAIAFSHVIEQQKGPLKRALRLGFYLLRRRFLRPAPERQRG